MSITLDSEESVFQSHLALYAQQFPTMDLSEKSYLGLRARADAQATMLFLRAVEQADDDSVPAFKQDSDGTVLTRCSTAALDAWAITYALPSGTPGVLGRKGASISSGGIGTPTCGVNGTAINAGTQLVDSTGQVTVQTVSTIATNGPPNTVALQLVSITTGQAANLPAGSVLTFVSPPAGVSAQMTLMIGLTAGKYRESDGDLDARILFRLQNPPRGGTAADYRYWAESATDTSGKGLSILRAYVYPLRSGLGTVDVLLTIAGTGPSRDPGATITAAVQTYLNGVRPVTATVNVLRPLMNAVKALRIRVRPTPYDKYAYDWVDGGMALTITAHNTGAKSITVAAVPLTLSAAWASGGKPRIQIIVSTTGASVLPFSARVTNIVGTTLTLDVFPPVAPTDAVDYFYAGGPIVDTIAAGIQLYINTIGPSRQSGFADPFDVWESSVTLARLADIVMEARDSDGTRMVQTIANLPSTGITIAVGAGAFAAADYQPLDVFGGIEIAFLRAGGIEVVSV